MTTIMMNDSSIVSRCLSDGENMILTRPETLIEGENYLYRDVNHSDDLAMSIVMFLAYTSCPAMVVIFSDSGQKVRCSRDSLCRRPPESYSANTG
jgi:hypothetical protein